MLRALVLELSLPTGSVVVDLCVILETSFFFFLFFFLAEDGGEALFLCVCVPFSRYLLACLGFLEVLLEEAERR